MPKDSTTVRTIVISDTHLLPPRIEVASIFPRRVHAMPPEHRDAFYIGVSREIRRAYDASLAEMKRQDPDVIVHLGDLTCGWGDGGMSCETVCDLAEEMAEDLKAYGKPVYCCLGNHDLQAFHGDPDARLHLATEAYEALFERLTWHYVSGSTLHIGVCAPLADYDGHDPDLQRRAREQQEQVADVLQSHTELPFILYAHSPLSIRHLMKQIAPHVSRCATFLVGHYHQPQIGSLFRGIARMSRAVRISRPLMQLFDKLIVAPSTAPLWYRGYGIMQVEGNRVEQLDVERPADSEEVPTASLGWCLRSASRDHLTGWPAPITEQAVVISRKRSA